MMNPVGKEEELAWVRAWVRPSWVEEGAGKERERQ
jgi:hypothetical protein